MFLLFQPLMFLAKNVIIPFILVTKIRIGKKAFIVPLDEQYVILEMSPKIMYCFYMRLRDVIPYSTVKECYMCPSCVTRVLVRVPQMLCQTVQF